MSVIVMTDRIRSLRAVVFAALCVALAATAHVSMSGSGVSAPVLVGAFGLVLGLTWLLAGRRRGLTVISLWMVAAQTALHLTFEQAGTLFAGGGASRTPPTDWASLLLCNPDSAPVGVTPDDLAVMAGLDPDVPPAGVQAATAAHHAHGAAAAPDLPSGAGTGLTGQNVTGQNVTGQNVTGQSVTGQGAGGHAMGGHDMAAHGMSTGMIAAHVLAALACALLLWRGETALVRLFDLLGALGAVLAGALLAPLLALFGRPAGYRPPGAPRPVGHRTRLPRLVLLSHALVRRGPPLVAYAR
ncbi:hypothetical protein [Kitasatospora purpeofusca]|uniref:hypothetical protein n=1 Tax=Kitasatospora purpeofusca TaxID=67352 RepID=UPI00224D3223|nr:hypothetical protein [Kitasatospora purpeofusca]MCX4756898.1 hypothetical protein [Kitasatospora purpeofusca]WSR35327.1 hypothetical protein OG715_32825 [Kitasatospora purpeofusca]